VDYESARAIGAEGERLVAETLQRLSVRYGFRQLDNVLLKVGKVTAEIDHLLVDQHGIVLVESKVRGAAFIRGNDAEKSWTACYPGGRNKRFQNPIRQNQWHDAALRQVLRDSGMELEPDYIDTLVVFVGAELSGLSLRKNDRQRVLDVGELEDYFAKRAEPSDLRPPLIAAFVTDLLQALLLRDKSQDGATLAAHAAHRSGKYGDSADADAPGRWPSPVKHSGVTIPLRRGRMRAALINCLLLFLALGLLYLFAASGGLQYFTGLLLTPFFKSLAPTVQPAGSAAPAPSLAVAQARLKELAPDVYAAATDLNAPQIAAAANGTAFTWEYVTRPTPNTAAVRSFTLVLGPDGAMRSMGASK
jgi:hypothetical protein